MVGDRCRRAAPITYRVGVAGADEEGAALGPASYFTFETDRDIGGINLASRPGGLALAWSHLEELHLVLLDGDGAPTTQPTVIASGASFSSHMARHGDGLALGLIAGDDEGETDVRLLLLDGDGVPRGEPLQVPTRRDRRHRGPFVMSSGAELLLAWEEGYFPPQDEGDVPTGHAIVRIARITDGGELAGPVLRVQASETGLVNVNPTLLPVEGAVALSWSRGRMRPICGGCVTDNVMQFVLLDSEDLAPVSDVVEVSGPSGLTSAPITTADGDNFAYLLAVDYHGRFDLAAAMVHCEPGP